MFFLELSCFFDDPADAGNLISGSSAFSKTSLNIWKFTVHVLLKPGLENFEHYFTSVCCCCCCWVASVVANSVRPHIRQPTRLPRPWYSPGKNTGVGYHNCVVVWAFFGIAFLWGWNENWSFPVLSAPLSFPNVLAYWVQHFHNISFRIWNSSTGIPSPPLALFIVMLSKAQLTSRFRMSGSRWVILASWLSWSWRSFCTVLPCILATSS